MIGQNAISAIRASQEASNDDFVKQLLFSVERLLLDGENPARLNLIASCFRELLTYQLDNIAPHDDVMKCDWYEQSPDTDRATRPQRIRYAVSGGLPDNVLVDIGVNDLYSPTDLRDLYAMASKYTHVRPGRLGHSDSETEAFVLEGLSSLEDFVSEIHEIRDQVQQHLQDAITEHTLEEFIGNVIDSLDILSSHTRVEYPQIEGWQIESIGYSYVLIGVDGYVEVELNYGSAGDHRRGDGATIYDGFPYQMNIRCPVNNIKKLETVAVNVDTFSWFE